MAGAVSPARMSVVPSALLFLWRRFGWALLASELCNWSTDVFSRGNGSDMVGEGIVSRLGRWVAGDAPGVVGLVPNTSMVSWQLNDQHGSTGYYLKIAR